MEKTPKNAKNFYCENCEFRCSKQSDWNRHITRPKHVKNQNNIVKNAVHMCVKCEKIYKYNSGLWNHYKTCDAVNNYQENIDHVRDSSNNDIKMLTNLVLEVVKSNTELQKQCSENQKQMIELCKNNNNNTTTHNTTTNSHNKTFNLQFFLNEECKDAMNLQDFIESVQMQMADLETIGELGYVEGVSKFIMGKLNETDVNKRPVHCSDAKRETLYVKDDNVWTKEGAENVKIRGAVKKIEKKNIKLLNVWKEAHAGCMDSESPYNDQYTHMIIGSLGGCEPDNVNKVIKKIAKATIIDK